MADDEEKIEYLFYVRVKSNRDQPPPRPGRQIPAYTEVMLSQMPWGCPGGGAGRGWI